MRIRPHLVLSLLIAAAGACTGNGHGDDDDDDLPPPPYAIRFLDTEASPTEEVPALFRVEVTTTDGSQIVAWSGSIEMTSDVGPLSPASIPVVDGEGSANLVFEIAGSDSVTFTNPDVREQLITFNILPRLPAKSAGAAAFGSVLAEGAGWDADGAWGPAALAEGAGVRIYYASSSSGAPSIGTAYAADGVTFVKSANPIVGPGVSADACHTDGADRPAVVRTTGTNVVMLYEGVVGTTRHLCVATSTDGLTFTPQGLAIDVSPVATEFDHDAVRAAAVVTQDDGSLLVYYGGEAQLEVDAINIGPETVTGIGTAVSTDGGLVWTKVPGGVYGAHVTSYAESTNLNSWDGLGIYSPAVFRDGPVYRIWLSGYSGGMIPRIGLYEIIDPFTFTAHVDNLEQTLHEIVPAGAAGEFDDDGTEMPSVVEDAAGVRRIYYTGRRDADGVRRIGAGAF